MVDAFGKLRRVDRELDIHIAFDLAAAKGHDEFLGRLGDDGPSQQALVVDIKPTVFAVAWRLAPPMKSATVFETGVGIEALSLSHAPSAGWRCSIGRVTRHWCGPILSGRPVRRGWQADALEIGPQLLHIRINLVANELHGLNLDWPSSHLPSYLD